MILKIKTIINKNYLLILITLLFLMLSFDSKKDLTPHDPTKKEDIQYVTVGDSIDYQIDYFKDLYDFNQVEMHEESYLLSGNIESSIYALSIRKEETNQFFYMNHRKEIISKKQGVARLSVSFYKNDKFVESVDLGLFVILNDLTVNDTWVGLNSTNFYDEINDNPNGRFYLEDDVLLDSQANIDYFSGTLLNPNRHTISLDLLSYDYYNQGLFKTLEGAYIDGLIIKESTMKPTTYDRIETLSMGFLASYAGNSMISNVSVEGHITSDINSSVEVVGGIVGVSYGTIYRHVSFVGSIQGDFNQIGGLIGIARFDHRFSSTGLQNNVLAYDMIDGAYVVADIDSNKDYISYRVRGFIGNISDQYTSIRHGYFDGSIDSIEVYDDFPFFKDSFSRYRVSYLYSTFGPLHEDRERYTFDIDEYKEISQAELKSRESLSGLSMFIFNDNEYPLLTYWRLP
jgi:hypothetical protein